MDIDTLIGKLLEIKSKHGGDLDVGFKDGFNFIESMFVDLKYVNMVNRFVVDEFGLNSKPVVVIE